MNNRHFIGLVILVFAIALAIVLGMQLTGQAAVIVFGAAVGVIIGVPAGLVSAYLVHRLGWFPTQPPAQQIDFQGLEAGALMLTAEQAETLYALIQRLDALNAATPAPTSSQNVPVLTRPPARQRDISVVGGADLTQSLDDQSSE